MKCEDELDFRIKSKLTSNIWQYKSYPQVFEDRNGFIGGRSILDAIFHGGPEQKDGGQAYLCSSNKTQTHCLI